MGQKIKLLNGFIKMPFNESMSLAVPCKNQREIDMYWKKLISGGGKPVQCGWLIDQFGVRWQIYPAEIEKWQSSKNKKRTNSSSKREVTIMDCELIPSTFISEQFHSIIPKWGLKNYL